MKSLDKLVMKGYSGVTTLASKFGKDKYDCIGGANLANGVFLSGYGLGVMSMDASPSQYAFGVAALVLGGALSLGTKYIQEMYKQGDEEFFENYNEPMPPTYSAVRPYALLGGLALVGLGVANAISPFVSSELLENGDDLNTLISLSIGTLGLTISGFVSRQYFGAQPFDPETSKET